MDRTNIASVDTSDKSLRRQKQVAAAEMELACVRVMLANDNRASELVALASNALVLSISSET